MTETGPDKQSYFAEASETAEFCIYVNLDIAQPVQKTTTQVTIIMMNKTEISPDGSTSPSALPETASP